MARNGERTILPALAILGFLAAALAYLPAARFLRYATIAFFAREASWHLALPVVVLLALLRAARFVVVP